MFWEFCQAFAFFLLLFLRPHSSYHVIPSFEFTITEMRSSGILFREQTKGQYGLVEKGKLIHILYHLVRGWQISMVFDSVYDSI